MLPSDVATFLSGTEIALADHPGLTLRRLVPADRDRVLRFRADIVSGIGNPDLARLTPNEDQFVQRSLLEDHMAMGVFRDGRMIAYTSMFLPLTEEHLRELHIHEHASPRAAAHHVAYVAGVMVDPAQRGLGLQRRLAGIRQAATAELDRSHHFGTNNFANFHSWRNTLDSGWRIVGNVDYTDPRFGPTSRIRTYWTPVHRPLAGSTTWVESQDIPTQRSLLATGHVGTGYRMRDGKLEIAYQRETV